MDLFVTRKWPPAVGGMETYCVELTNELESHTALRKVVLPGKEDGSPPSPTSLIGFAARFIFRYLRSKPPRTLHIGDLASWPLALVTLLRSPRPNIVISVHGTDAGYAQRKHLKGKLYRAYLKAGATLLRSAKLISNSTATKDAAAETGWCTQRIIPLATNLRAANPPTSCDGHILYAGRLIPRKGCRWFVENVRTEIPVKIAGTIWDEEESEVLKHPRVEFLGSLSQEKLLSEYRRALCVVVPNIEIDGDFEGFGLVAPEAAAVGAVVLAARTGGLVEAVHDGVTGFLLEPGEPAEWESKLGEIAGWDYQRRHEFIAASMAEAQRRYSWSRVAEEVLQVYRSS